MSNLEEIENRMNQTKNILHKCALKGQINILDKRKIIYIVDIKKILGGVLSERK